MLAKFRNKGYLLIESLVAITLVVVGLLGIFSLLSQSLSLNRVVSDRYVASYLAAEGLEVTKNLVDNNVLAGRAWNSGLAAGQYQFDQTINNLPPACGANCNKTFYFDDTRKIYSYLGGGQSTTFKRIISVQPITDQAGLVQSLRVNSTISWIGRGSGQFAINLEDHFYNYR